MTDQTNQWDEDEPQTPGQGTCTNCGATHLVREFQMGPDDWALLRCDADGNLLDCVPVQS